MHPDSADYVFNAAVFETSLSVQLLAKQKWPTQAEA
jgi:hypothetical protein